MAVAINCFPAVSALADGQKDGGNAGGGGPAAVDTLWPA
jgi:hypothetical protein